jgi:hypothetical protein
MWLTKSAKVEYRITTMTTGRNSNKVRDEIADLVRRRSQALIAGDRLLAECLTLDMIELFIELGDNSPKIETSIKGLSGETLYFAGFLPDGSARCARLTEDEMIDVAIEYADCFYFARNATGQKGLTPYDKLAAEYLHEARMKQQGDGFGNPDELLGQAYQELCPRKFKTQTELVSSSNLHRKSTVKSA